MRINGPIIKKSVEHNLIEEIYQLKINFLGEGEALCEACSRRVTAGSPVIACFSRSAESDCYTIDGLRCADHPDCPDGFTDERDAVLVRGRMARCADQAMQTSWPVFLGEAIVSISRTGSTELTRVCGPTEQTDGFQTTLPTAGDGGWTYGDRIAADVNTAYEEDSTTNTTELCDPIADGSESGNSPTERGEH